MNWDGTLLSMDGLDKTKLLIEVHSYPFPLTTDPDSI